MGKSYKVTIEDAKMLREAADRKESRRFCKRLLAVALRGEGKSNREAGEITGFHPSYISHLVSIYANHGMAALASDGRKGGNHRNMSSEEELEFLKRFEAKAEKGHVANAKEIALEYDKATGKERKSKSTVYYLMHKLIRIPFSHIFSCGQNARKLTFSRSPSRKWFKLEFV